MSVASWQKGLWLVLAGSLGTLCRAYLSAGASRLWGTEYPWGTSLVNVFGCLLFGLVWALAERGLPGSASVRYIVLTGFMGAFTTFSTYLFETSAMLASGRLGVALVNLVAQNVLGLGAIMGGMALGRWI